MICSAVLKYSEVLVHLTFIQWDYRFVFFEIFTNSNLGLDDSLGPALFYAKLHSDAVREFIVDFIQFLEVSMSVSVQFYIIHVKEVRYLMLLIPAILDVKTHSTVFEQKGNCVETQTQKQWAEGVTSWNIPLLIDTLPVVICCDPLVATILVFQVCIVCAKNPCIFSLILYSRMVISNQL
jgi:hypothetical protein